MRDIAAHAEIEGKQDGLLLLRVKGGSMWPFVQNDNTVLCDPARKPHRGDIVIYRNAADTLVCHRVTKVTADAYELKGDFSGGTAETVKPEAMLGTVTAVMHRGKIRPAGGMKGKILLAALPVLRPLLRMIAACYEWAA